MDATDAYVLETTISSDLEISSGSGTSRYRIETEPAEFDRIFVVSAQETYSYSTGYAIESHPP